LPLQPDSHIGRYRIVARLGGGGMGDVYRAHDPLLGRDVAVKVVSEPDSADQGQIRRFTREAQAASALNHPNIVTVFDVGHCDAGPFIVMELIEGETLRARLRAGADLRALLQIGQQVARALAVAHAAGIVHRDIKPENVMVRADGYVKVVDFGLARVEAAGLDGDAETMAAPPAASLITEAQSHAVILGTAAYLAPEQARGEALTSAADVFALGVTFYEIAARRHPFAGAGYFTTVARILSEAAVAPSRFNPDVPPALDTLILSMLEKDPRLRPDAAEVERTLAAVAGEPEGLARLPVALPERHTVGHDDVREELRRAFDAAATGRGSMVALAGEPGMGKTTLIEDFLRELAASGRSCTVARGRCSERLAGAGAYLPWLEALDSMRDETGGTAARLLKTVAPTWYAQVAPLDTGEESPEVRLATVNRAGSQEWMKRELGTFVEEVSRHRPLVLFMDDVQWADPSTVDLIAYVAGRLASTRVLLLATYRASDLMLERHPFQQLQLDLQGRGIAREIPIDLLARDDVERYLALEFPENRFPPEFAAFVHARTEGHPLFMADLLRTLRDRQIVRRDEGVWRLIRPIGEFEKETPASIRSMIELKIARLSEEDRRLLVAASVQGHEFEAATVARALALDAGDVEDALDRLGRQHALVRSVREMEFPDRTLTVRYRFAHALYQNSLYASLGPARRASLSRAVAQALVDTHGEQAVTRASELALLFQAARDFSRAAEFFAVASERARQVFAYREALTLATRGMEMLEAVPATPDRAPRELLHLMSIAVATHPLRGYAAPELEGLYGRLQTLCDQIGDGPEIFGPLCALGAFRFMRADLRPGLTQMDRMAAIVDAVNDPIMRIWTEWGYGAAYSHTGEFAKAHVHLERGISAYTPALHPGLMVMTGYDAGIGCHFQDARVLWTLGYPDAAARRMAEAMALARRSGHPLMILFTLVFAAWIRQLRQEPHEVLAVTAEGLPLVDQYGFPHIAAWLSGFHGWAMARSGDAPGGEQHLRDAVALSGAIGVALMRPHYLTLLADAVALQGRIDEALTILDEAEAIAERVDERYYSAETQRLRGHLLQRQGLSAAGVEPSLRQALSIAQAQAARGFELRAATSLAACLEEQGRWQEARRVLEPAVAWFTEGFDTPDYVAAVDRLNALPR
jgi:tetratricopeptide (TPR) repeat protein